MIRRKLDKGRDDPQRVSARRKLRAAGVADLSSTRLQSNGAAAVGQPIHMVVETTSRTMITMCTIDHMTTHD